MSKKLNFVGKNNNNKKKLKDFENFILRLKNYNIINR